MAKSLFGILILLKTNQLLLQNNPERLTVILLIVNIILLMTRLTIMPSRAIT